MERSLVIFAIFCFFSCRGLDITLDRKTQIVFGGRSLCGILTCTEIANASISPGSNKDQDGLNVLMQTITSLSVYKRSPSASDNSPGQRDTELGSVTSQAPTLLRVSNGRKINGVLDSERASLRLELIKREDCQAQFICQVRGIDHHGTEIINSAYISQQSGNKGDQTNGGDLVPSAMSFQVFTMLQQLVVQSMGDLEKSVTGAVKSVESKIEQQEINFNDRMNYLENRLEDQISQLRNDLIANSDTLQTEMNTKIDSFEHRLGGRLDLFENRVEDKIDNTCNNNLSKLMGIDLKVSTQLGELRSDVKTEFQNGLDYVHQKLDGIQRDVLGNVSQSFQNALRSTSSVLTSLETDLDRLVIVNQANMLAAKNSTESIRELLTSGEVLSQCVVDNPITSAVSDCNQLIPLYCERDMGKDNKNLSHYMLTSQPTLHREVLCDTHTDGGGWVVIQRRTKGDVYFNRDWEAYKTGFGNLDLDGDFWLGNEAVHILTYVQPHELRVEITIDGEDCVSTYETFKLESESENYRIRLGAVTSPIDDGSGRIGLFYSNNMAFSTFNRDNDNHPGNCALNYHSGWWYKICQNSNLNSPWDDGKIQKAWDAGFGWESATRSEMKIRVL